MFNGLDIAILIAILICLAVFIVPALASMGRVRGRRDYANHRIARYTRGG